MLQPPLLLSGKWPPAPPPLLGAVVASSTTIAIISVTNDTGGSLHHSPLLGVAVVELARAPSATNDGARNQIRVRRHPQPSSTSTPEARGEEVRRRGGRGGLEEEKGSIISVTTHFSSGQPSPNSRGLPRRLATVLETRSESFGARSESVGMEEEEGSRRRRGPSLASPTTPTAASTTHLSLGQPLPNSRGLLRRLATTPETRSKSVGVLSCPQHRHQKLEG